MEMVQPPQIIRLPDIREHYVDDVFLRTIQGKKCLNCLKNNHFLLDIRIGLGFLGFSWCSQVLLSQKNYLKVIF